MDTGTKHRRQIRSSLLIGALFIALCPVEALLVFTDTEPPVWVKLVLGVYTFALVAGMVFVLQERIREIRKGETDDLDNY